MLLALLTSRALTVRDGIEEMTGLIFYPDVYHRFGHVLPYSPPVIVNEFKLTAAINSKICIPQLSAL